MKNHRSSYLLFPQTLWVGSFSLIVGVGSPEPALAEVDVDRYQLSLEINDDLSLSGSALIDVTALSATPEITLDLVGYEVTNPTWQGQPVAINRGENSLTFLLPTPISVGESGQLSVSWHGASTPYVTPQGDLGLISDRSITYAINATEGAHHWFPCKDRLDDKASVMLSLVVPKGSLSAGPGHLINIFEVSPLKETHTWSSAEEITPYLISFAYSDRFEKRTLTIPTAEGELLGEITLLPGTFDSADHALEIIPPMTAWLVDRYGAFPAPKVGFHEITFPGAMEQPGYIGMGTFYWSGDPRLDVYFAHELSHTWFQGKVTIKTWDDVWLSEGIAAWHELLWIEESQGLEAADAQAAVYIDAYRVGMASEGIFPISDPDEVFGYTTYMKGPTVWRLLEHLAGREVLLGVLSDYLEDADGLANLDTFFTYLDDLQLPILATFREDWIDRAGLPSYKFGWATAPSEDMQGVVIQLSQGAGPLYKTPVDVHLTFEDGHEEIHQIQPTETDTTLKLCLEDTPVSVSLDPRKLIPRGSDDTLTRFDEDPVNACVEEPPAGCEERGGLPWFLSAIFIPPLLLRRRRSKKNTPTT